MEKEVEKLTQVPESRDASARAKLLPPKKDSAFITEGCNDEIYYELGGLKQLKFTVTVLETRSRQPRCEKGCALSEASRTGYLLASFSCW